MKYQHAHYLVLPSSSTSDSAAADKTGGSGFVLSRAKTERSWPDGSVHHVSSLVPLPRPVWLGPLSQQCTLSSVKVMVHMNVGKRGSSWLFQAGSLRQTRSQRQITRIRGHTSDLTIHFLFITLTFCCFEPHSSLLPPRTPATFNLGCFDLYHFVALNSTAELSQWRETKWLAWNGHRKIKQGRGELWNPGESKE